MASDNAPGNVVIQQTQGLPSGGSFPTGQTIRVIYIATDEVGNVATCSFTVTITRPGKDKSPLPEKDTNLVDY